MDTLRQFNLAMQYIEAHLEESIDFATVAQIAGCTEYHFRRVFSFLAHISLSEYVRRRRLSLAAAALRESNLRIIDLAVRYGYDSADAFTRAFQALHGVTPSEAREEDVPLKSFPPMTFQLTVRGGEGMDYRIVEKDAFSIVGLHKRIELIYKGINPEIADMWNSLTEEDIELLSILSDLQPQGIVNASVNFADDRAEGTTLDHYIGVATTQPHHDKWQVLPVAASLWVVFTVKGKFPEATQDVWSRIYGEWLVTSGYEVNYGPEILWVDHETWDMPEVHSEIWIPIKRKTPQEP
ncbi:MAG: AraC family transcriptional regulator [Chloroflexota bacterium]|nr:AraC family transcriptional regulator [Chloroflexota bacterium]